MEFLGGSIIGVLAGVAIGINLEGAINELITVFKGWNRDGWYGLDFGDLNDLEVEDDGKTV